MSKLSEEKMDFYKELFHKGKYSELNTIIVDELKLLPENIFLINLSGLISLAKKEYDSSINYFNHCIKIKKDNNLTDGLGQLYSNIAKAYLADNKNDEALRNFILSIEYEPNHYDNINYIADLYFLKKDYQNALIYYNKSIQLDSSNIGVKFSKGHIYELINDFEKAKELYNEIIEIDPDNYKTWNRLGSISFKENNYEDSLEFYSWSNEIKNNNSGGLFGMARSYLYLKNIELAELTCNKLIENEKSKIEPYILYADIMFIKGDIYLAEKFYKESLKLDKNNPICYFYLSNFYENIYDYKNALKAINKSLSIDNNNKEAQKLAANINFKLKNYMDAKHYYSELEEYDKTLACLYFNNQIEDFNQLYNSKKNLLKDSRLISGILNHSNIVFNNNYEDSFCDKPFKFISSYILGSPRTDDINQEIIELYEAIGEQNTLNKKNTKGLRYPGNIFNSDKNAIKQLTEILIEKYNDYFIEYSNNDNNFIRNHPKNPKLFGSFIDFGSNESSKLINHTEGWLSGIYYLRHENNANSVINKFKIYNDLFPESENNKLLAKVIEKKSSDLIFFPSSLSSQIISNDKEIIGISFDFYPN